MSNIKTITHKNILHDSESVNLELLIAKEVYEARTKTTHLEYCEAGIIKARDNTLSVWHDCEIYKATRESRPSLSEEHRSTLEYGWEPKRYNNRKDSLAPRSVQDSWKMKSDNNIVLFMNILADDIRIVKTEHGEKLRFRNSYYDQVFSDGHYIRTRFLNTAQFVESIDLPISFKNQIKDWTPGSIFNMTVIGLLTNEGLKIVRVH